MKTSLISIAIIIVLAASFFGGWKAYLKFKIIN